MRISVWSAIFFSAVAATAVAQQDEKALATAIQLELNLLGSEASAPDGIWGSESKMALERYASKVAETLEEQPTNQLLARLQAERVQLWTLQPGVIAADDRSDAALLEAVKYSYKVWSTLPANVVSEKAEFGTLRCVAGKDGGPRRCAWQ